MCRLKNIVRGVKFYAISVVVAGCAAVALYLARGCNAKTEIHPGETYTLQIMGNEKPEEFHLDSEGNLVITKIDGHRVSAETIEKLVNEPH